MFFESEILFIYIKKWCTTTLTIHFGGWNLFSLRSKCRISTGPYSPVTAAFRFADSDEGNLLVEAKQSRAAHQAQPPGKWKQGTGWWIGRCHLWKSSPVAADKRWVKARDWHWHVSNPTWDIWTEELLISHREWY